MASKAQVVVDMDRPYERILSPVERTALEFIRERAEAGLPVTRADIAMAIGSQNLWGGTAPGVLNRLEEKGYITRTFYQRGLQVCDIASGKCTAPPASRATHWRHRTDRVPTLPVRTVRERSAPAAFVIESEARRAGIDFHEFQMQLLVNGLELWLENQEEA